MGGVLGCCDRQFDISSRLNRMGVFSLPSQRNFHADGIKCVSSVGVYMRGHQQKSSDGINNRRHFLGES